MSAYRQIKYWSILHDCEVARISMCDGRGAEFFVIFRDNAGVQKFRENRDAALDMLIDALEAQENPGERFLT